MCVTFKRFKRNVSCLSKKSLSHSKFRGNGHVGQTAIPSSVWLKISLPRFSTTFPVNVPLDSSVLTSSTWKSSVSVADAATQHRITEITITNRSRSMVIADGGDKDRNAFTSCHTNSPPTWTAGYLAAYDANPRTNNYSRDHFKYKRIY